MSIETISIIAIVFATVIAPLGTLFLGNKWSQRKEERDRKYQILLILMSGRTEHISRDHIRHLNAIDLIFYDEKEVRDAWSNYINGVSGYAIGTQVNQFEIDRLKTELIQAVAAALGMGSNISHSDIVRVYNPVGLQREDYVKSEEIRLRAEQLMAQHNASAGENIGTSAREGGSDAAEPSGPKPAPG